MKCSLCGDGFIVVKASVHSGSNDPREPYSAGLNISYTCNICEKSIKVDTNKYPMNLDGLRRMIQRQLNADDTNGRRIPNDDPANGDPAFGWHG